MLRGRLIVGVQEIVEGAAKPAVGAQTVAVRHIVASAVAAHRKRIGDRRVIAGEIAVVPGHALIVRDRGAGPAAVPGLVDRGVRHVQGVIVEAVAATNNRLVGQGISESETRHGAECRICAGARHRLTQIIHAASDDEVPCGALAQRIGGIRRLERRRQRDGGIEVEVAQAAIKALLNTPFPLEACSEVESQLARDLVAVLNSKGQ